MPAEMTATEAAEMCDSIADGYEFDQQEESDYHDEWIAKKIGGYMNRSEVLKQCEGLRAEILQVMRDIDRLTKKPLHFAQDSVWASPAHEPYQNMPVPICGNVQAAAVQKELQERIRKYGDMLVELARKQNAAEDFLQTVPNAIDRVILRYRYIDGKQWKDIAAALTENAGRDYNENRVKKRAQRFFEKTG